MKENGQVTVVGVGLMGAGIAASAALAGHPTVLVARTAERAASGLFTARQNIDQLCEGKLVEPAQAQAAKTLLVAEVALDRALDGSFLVIEAIIEDVSAKQELFSELDRLTSPDALLTSNTSGLRITDITRNVVHVGRTATTHFWFPGHLVPLVEVVMGERTDEATVLQLRELLIGWGKAPVIVKKDLPGQLANRILQAVIREAVNIVQMGLASPEDVDTAIKMGMGIRFPVWGPLEHIDAVGLDLALLVQEGVLPGLFNEGNPPDYLRKLVESGQLGHKTGAGFYDWQVKDMAALAAKRDQFVMQALRILGFRSGKRGVQSTP